MQQRHIRPSIGTWRCDERPSDISKQYPSTLTLAEISQPTVQCEQPPHPRVRCSEPRILIVVPEPTKKEA